MGQAIGFAGKVASLALTNVTSLPAKWGRPSESRVRLRVRHVTTIILRLYMPVNSNLKFVTVRSGHALAVASPFFLSQGTKKSHLHITLYKMVILSDEMKTQKIV